MTRSDIYRLDVYLLYENCFIIQRFLYVFTCNKCLETDTKNEEIGHKGAVNDQEGDWSSFLFII